MSRTRAGRKSWETRIEFINEVGNFAAAMAAKEWKYDAETTRAMIIERTVKETGKKEVITFDRAYGELSMWLDKSFANISEDGFSDMLCDLFFQGSVIHTGKAIYRLWVKPEPKAETLPAASMLCLNNRKDEFRAALHRAENSDLEVYPDFERDSFVVVNKETKGEYRVCLQSAEGFVFASCDCPDFLNRRRICKHVSEVLADTFFGALYGRYPQEAGIVVTAHCGCLCDRANRKTLEYCHRHEFELEYRRSIAEDHERSIAEDF